MTTASDPESVETAFQIRHKALRNAFYHTARRGWLDGWSRFFNFLTIFGGSSAATSLINSDTNLTAIVGLGIAAVGSIQLVLDFTGRARLHEILQRRYYQLLAEIESTTEINKEKCASWTAEISRIAADEPPTLRALDAISDNQATASLLGAQKPRLAVNRWESFTRQILAHGGSNFSENSDWRSAPILSQEG